MESVLSIIVGATVIPLQGLILHYMIKAERRITAIETKLGMKCGGCDVAIKGGKESQGGNNEGKH